MSEESTYRLLRDAEAVAHVEKLSKTYKLRNHAEVYALAIRLLTWGTQALVDGKEIGDFQGGEFTPVNLPSTPEKDLWQSQG